MTEGLETEILVVSYNTRELLDGCLTSIERTTDGRRVGVAVWDNASSDQSAEMVAERHPSARLVRSDSNLGFGAANNRLAASSTARYLLLLNSDTLLTEDIISPLREVLETWPTPPSTGPRLVWGDGSDPGFEPALSRR